jgi:YHS domain-containing protein
MAIAGPDRLIDPICGLPLSDATAEERAQDALGGTALFCSPSCLDTWRRRPAAAAGRT